MEPVYEFIKGKGWIVQIHETLAGFRIHGDKRYRVTVIRRPPTLGERGWFIYRPDYSLKEVLNEVNWQFGGGGGFAWTCDGSRLVGVQREPKMAVTVVTEECVD